mgnify:CR=1 FL=1
MKARIACVSALAISALALAGLIAGATASFAQEKSFELKRSHWVPPSHPLPKAREEWGAPVEKEWGGPNRYRD